MMNLTEGKMKSNSKTIKDDGVRPIIPPPAGRPEKFAEGGRRLTGLSDGVKGVIMKYLCENCSNCMLLYSAEFLCDAKGIELNNKNLKKECDEYIPIGEPISSSPSNIESQAFSMEGWIARDKKNDALNLYTAKPIRTDKNEWMFDESNDIGDFAKLDTELLSNLKWEDEPIKVKIIEVKD